MELKLGIDVTTLSPLKKNLVLALPAVIIISLFAFLFIKPALDEKKALSEEIDKQKSEIAGLEKNSSRLPSLKADNKRLEERLADLQLQLPEEKEVSGLLKQVSELGIKSGLQVVVWKPGNRNVHASKEVHEIPVEVLMRGTYHKFGQFFGNVTTLNRIVNIFNINMRPSGQGLDVSFTAMTYSKLSEQEKKELQKREAKK